MTITHENDVVQRILAERPSFHLSGTAYWDALSGTLRTIQRLVRPGDVTFEVGAGVSTVVFTAAGAQHTAVSPDPNEHRLIRDYCQKIGVDDSNLKFLVGFSDDVLPVHLSRERVLDVAFVDGAHSFPLPVIDWYYVARALKVGGKLLLDDVPVPAVMPAFQHMNRDSAWQLDELPDTRSAEFTLLKEPELGDDWHHQPFNKGYPDYSYLSTPRQLLMSAEFKTRPMRGAIGRRFPALREFYHNRFKW